MDTCSASGFSNKPQPPCRRYFSPVLRPYELSAQRTDAAKRYPIHEWTLFVKLTYWQPVRTEMQPWPAWNQTAQFRS